jgi:negative regulator of flagellin synthesis FlgM
MSINNVNGGGVKTPIDNQKLSQQQVANNNTGSQQANASQTASAPRTDSVSLTSSAQQLTQVQKKSSEAPVNQDKVNKLKEAIQNGDYKVNAESVANKLTALETEIFGSKR